MRGAFNNYHPILLLSYFLLAAGAVMFWMHPFFLVVALFTGVAYHCKLEGKKAIKTIMVVVVPIVIFSALLNALVNHRGVTVLFMLFKKPITLESVLFGVCTGLSFGAVIEWFICFGKVFSSEKVLFLLNKVAPSLGMAFSLILNFIPNLLTQAKQITSIQRTLGVSVKDGNAINRAKSGLRILSVLVTTAMEGAVETADSMRSRGYGLTGRTSYLEYRFQKRDGILAAAIMVMIAILSGLGYVGMLSSSFFPVLHFSAPSITGWLLIAAYYALPVLVDFYQEAKWIYLQSKI